MSAVYVQDNLKLKVSTPLGPNKLLLRAFRGEERISGLFQFTLEMVSEDDAIDFQAIVGKAVTITLNLSNNTEHYLNGIVGRFVQEETNLRLTRYFAEIHPWLWLLTKTSDCRVFQNKSAPDIIESVFSDLGFSDFRNDLKANYDKRDYCVQYNETAFNFVSRLMEEEGIFYYFEHGSDKHTLVLGDDSPTNPTCSGGSPVHFRQSLVDHAQDLTITRCLVEEQVVTGSYAHDDFNFETPNTDLKVESKSDTPKFRVYEYPGGFVKKDSGEKRADLRLDALEQPQKIIRGDGFVRAFCAGHKFELKDHYRPDVNKTYVLQSVSHAASQETYTNSFTAFPADLAFRPPRVTPKPTISGTQTAIVVGKAGEEIWTDKYGRVKVQFHWDQLGKNDENSSCWIRVDYGWAGKQWGGIFLPRIGQEVVVSYLEGDPDRPLITGAVYNSDQVVPYTLPDEQTKSTVKTNSSKGGGGFNEIRFEDKKGSEELYFHAQKDHNIVVENDRTKKVLHNETNTIKGTRDLTVTGNETHTNDANFTQKVAGNYELKVTGNLTIEATGTITIKSSATTVESTGITTIKGSLVKIN
jgi:type VI secretion system secreted protein VgrG